MISSLRHLSNPLLRAGFLFFLASVAFAATPTVTSVPSASAASSVPAPQVVSAGLLWEALELRAESREAEEFLDFKFSYTNPGSRTIRIQKVDTSCSCTVADVSSLELAPGATGTLRARLQLRGMTGTVRRSVMVTTDAEPESAHLTLQADITPLLAASSRLVWWALNETPKEKEFLLTLSQPEETQIISVESEAKAFVVELAPGASSSQKRVLVRPVTTDIDAQARIPVTYSFKGKTLKLFLIAAVK